MGSGNNPCNNLLPQLDTRLLEVLILLNSKMAFLAIRVFMVRERTKWTNKLFL